MKILLLNPPSHGKEKFVREGRCMQRGGAWTAIWSPVSLATTAAVLRRDGHELKLYDCVVEEMDREGLRDAVSHFRPDLVVLNSSTPSIHWDLGTADVIAEILPDVFTVAFGIHVSALPFESLMLARRLDAVVIAEPEYAVRDLATALQGKATRDERSTAALAVPGLAVRQGRRLRRTPPRPAMADLNELPFPAWDLVNPAHYTLPFTGEPFLLVATGRGCPHRCSFCAAHAYYGKKLRLRKPGLVVDEIETNLREYGVRHFLFWTEAFTMRNDYALAVCEEILARKLDVRWICNSRVDDVNPALLRRMKDAGCSMVGYGIESANPDVLEAVEKGISLDQIRRAVRWTKEAGLEVTGHLMVGFPGEDRAAIRRTADLAVELDLDFAQFYSVVPFPGSRLFDQAKAAGSIVNWDFAMFEQNYGVLHTGHLTPAEVMRERGRAYRRFYFRPITVWRTIRRLRHPVSWWRFVGMVKDFLTWI